MINFRCTRKIFLNKYIVEIHMLRNTICLFKDIKGLEFLNNTRNLYRFRMLFSSNTEHFMKYHDFRSDYEIRQRWSDTDANTVVIKTIDFDCIVSMILKSVVLMTTSVTRKVCGHNLKRTFASAIDLEDFGVGNDLHRQYRQKIFFFSHETIIEIIMSKMK